MDTPAGEALNAETPVVLRLRKRLEAWLSEEGARSTLSDWLRGYELPAVGHAEEPYVWMLRALSFSDDSARRELARRAALLLDDGRPHEGLRGRGDEDLLYNLLYLCAGLRCREELSEPLYRVYDFFARDGARAFPADSRYDLRGALRDALIPNQTDERLRGVWGQMLGGRPHEMLQGGRYAGFDGLIHMPVRESGRYAPAAGEIGRALAKMAEHLEDEKERHESFRRLVERAREAWPRYDRWNEDLLRQAISNDWPTWAFTRLDTLVVSLGAESDEPRHYLMWKIYLPCLEELRVKFEVVGRHLRGEVFEIRASAEAALLLEKVSATIEYIRLRAPFRSYRGIIGAANQGFMELESYFASKGEHALVRAVRQGRTRVLEALGLKVNLNDLEGEPEAEVTDRGVSDDDSDDSARPFDRVPVLLKDFFPLPESRVWPGIGARAGF